MKELATGRVVHLDLSATNERLNRIVHVDTPGLCAFVDSEMEASKATVGVGGYAENRLWYERSLQFKASSDGDGFRSIHLGVDIWVPAETPVYAPLDGTIHSFQDNANFGDYGPTIIVKHQIDNVSFHTLYGHLTRPSLDGKEVGAPIKKGEVLGWVGNFPENGDWPPHLHFQLIEDMEGLRGDYPGVAAASKADWYLRNCPDPNLLMRLEELR